MKVNHMRPNAMSLTVLRNRTRDLAVITTLLIAGVSPAIATIPAGTTSNSAVQAADDGPDPTRRANEDAAIAAARDEVARSEARLDAAAAALRVDLPPRIRTRLWWATADPAMVARAVEAANRADALASATFTDLLVSDAPAKERLQARASVIGATARLLRERAGIKAPEDWSDRLAAYRGELADAPNQTSKIDGPTLLIVAAATLAADPSATDAAREFQIRAGSQPQGIDAMEFALIGGILDDQTRGRGLDAATRVRASERLLADAHPAGDRLLLGGIQLRSRLEAGESLTAASDATRRSVISARSLDAADRVRLLRALAAMVAASAPKNETTSNLPPLAALGRLAPVLASTDPAAGRRPEVKSLLARAMSSPIPTIRAEALLDGATIAMRNGDAVTARDSIASMVETLPSHPKALTAASLAVRLGDSSGDSAIADDISTRMLKSLPDHPDRDSWLLAQGRRAGTRGDILTARAAYESIPATSPMLAEATIRDLQLDFETIRRMQQNNGLTRTLARLDGIESLISQDVRVALRVEADLLRIQALEGLGRSSSAAEIAARYTDPTILPEPLRIDAVRLATVSLRNAGRTEEANQLLDALARVEPDASSQITGRLLAQATDGILAAIDRNDREDARKRAQSALRANPIDLERVMATATADPNTGVRLGWLLAASGDRATALRLADAIIAERPSAMEAIHLRAVLLGGRLDSMGRTRKPPSTKDAGKAVTDLRRISKGTGRGSIWWWRSEIEQLEILVSLGRNLDRIETRIERIRKEFADLGGPDFERRINALRPVIAEARRRAGN